MLSFDPPGNLVGVGGGDVPVGGGAGGEAVTAPSLICPQSPGSPASSPDCKPLADRTGVSHLCICRAQHRVMTLRRF